MVHSMEASIGGAARTKRTIQRTSTQHKKRASAGTERLIACGNPQAKWRMHSVTVLHVQSHGTCSARGMATLPHHPQLHNRTDISVHRYYHTVGVCIMQMMRGRTTARHAKHRTLHWLPHQIVCTELEGMLYSVQHAC